ncbi:MAG: dephospho-CoA kinase [Actinomycetota bacterium]|nr:dephospho-CoA kinase [Actinomycetota bacterium]
MTVPIDLTAIRFHRAAGADSGPHPLVVGLTGGTGVGKSTVCARLRDAGAVIVDCDQLGRDVVAPGGPALEPLFERFGPTVRAADGSLDRAALASIVFNDPMALTALNAITHPAIDRAIAERIADAAPEAIVVLDMAVLVESTLGRDSYQIVAVIESTVELRIERLAGRGMSPEDARARMASQATDEQRRAVAHLALDNSGELEALDKAVGALWRRLVELEAATRSPQL